MTLSAHRKDRGRAERERIDGERGRKKRRESRRDGERGNKRFYSRSS